MKKYIVAMVLLYGIQSYAQSHTGFWDFTNVSTDSLTEVTHLFFSDSNNGYLGGTFQSDAVFSYSVPRWFRTVDGGKSWSWITFKGLPSNIAAWFNVGYGAATPSMNSVFLADWQDPSFIYYSHDNGTLWDSIRCDLDLFQYFTMFTEKEGIGIGGTNGGVGYPVIRKTTDGGKSFPIKLADSLFSSSLAESRTSSFFFNAADFSDSLHGTFIVSDENINNGKGLTTLITGDGAHTWKKTHTDFPAFANDTLFGNIQYQKGSSNLWLMPFKGKTSNTSDYFRWQGLSKNQLSYCFSSDYGKTWSYNTSFAGKIAALYGVTPLDIWMLLFPKNVEKGAGDFGMVYTITHSIDSGLSWDVDSLSIGYASDLGKCNASAMYFTDANHGWIATIHDSKPYVFKYYPVKNAVIEHLIPARRQLPVFPDPANDHVTIALPEGSMISQVNICDIVGRQYPALYKIQNNIVVLDTRELPPGIWLALVKHIYGTNTTRFILQK